MDGDFAGNTITIGSIATGILALPYIIYKTWRGLKSDNRGDDVDGRITAFTSTIQAQLDKALSRADQLQKDYADVVSKLATAQARAEYLAQENELMRAELQKLRDTAAKFAASTTTSGS